MKQIGHLLTATAAVALFAGPASAGSKWQTNIVDADGVDPAITVKSKVQFKDKGLLKAKIAGLTDEAGAVVTTDFGFKEFGASGMDGDEYMLILSGVFPALGVDFEFNLPIEAKEGKGKGKLDASSLFLLIPAGVWRASELTTVKLVGPIGAAEPALNDCKTNIIANGTVILGAINPCDTIECNFSPPLACATNADCPATTNCSDDSACVRDSPIKCNTTADCPELLDSNYIAPETCEQNDLIGVGGVLIP
jgi:hypothetical protein